MGAEKGGGEAVAGEPIKPPIHSTILPHDKTCSGNCAS